VRNFRDAIDSETTGQDKSWRPLAQKKNGDHLLKQKNGDHLLKQKNGDHLLREKSKTRGITPARSRTPSRRCGCETSLSSQNGAAVELIAEVERFNQNAPEHPEAGH